MHRLVLKCVCACLLSSLPARAQKPEKDCFDTAMTQLDLNGCAGEQLAAADAELNRVYKAVVEKYKEDALFVEKLRAAQRAWLAFRDAEIEAKYPHAKDPHYYGSSLGMCDPIYRTQLTQERTKKLREWLDGSEEGDICSGSVEVK